MNNATSWEQDAPTAIALDQIITIDNAYDATKPVFYRDIVFTQVIHISTSNQLFGCSITHPKLIRHLIISRFSNKSQGNKAIKQKKKSYTKVIST
ncbi:hypothetical protein [Dapis sp. BLCC M229]|uniref:hypothetical protein n=1 Tax=Dapis sp. BLCC M229 TaxID=3400188 RepID=UPI003CF43AD2